MSKEIILLKFIFDCAMGGCSIQIQNHSVQHLHKFSNILAGSSVQI